MKCHSDFVRIPAPEPGGQEPMSESLHVQVHTRQLKHYNWVMAGYEHWLQKTNIVFFFCSLGNKYFCGIADTVHTFLNIGKGWGKKMRTQSGFVWLGWVKLKEPSIFLDQHFEFPWKALCCCKQQLVKMKSKLY